MIRMRVSIQSGPVQRCFQLLVLRNEHSEQGREKSRSVKDCDNPGPKIRTWGTQF
jgi:hypothetical protein